MRIDAIVALEAATAHLEKDGTVSPFWWHLRAPVELSGGHSSYGMRSLRNTRVWPLFCGGDWRITTALSLIGRQVRALTCRPHCFDAARYATTWQFSDRGAHDGFCIHSTEDMDEHAVETLARVIESKK